MTNAISSLHTDNHSAPSLSPRRPGTGGVAALARLRHLRVLQVGKYYPPYRGGMETHLEQLSTFLSSNVDLQVLVSNDKNKTLKEITNGVRITRLARLCNLSSAPVCPTMAKAIANAAPDLVHLHFPNPMALLAYMASNHRGPLVVTWHSDIVRQVVLARLFRPIIESLLRRCCAIIVTSPNYLDSSTLLRDNREKCRVIPFGILVERFQHADQGAVAAIRAHFGSKIILAVGRLVYYKGFRFLIRALSKVRGGKLLIIGDGPLRRELETEAASYGVRDRVHFLGAVPDPVPYYAACDVFALPSIARSEAFGIVQLEALAAGKPVVNTLLRSGVPYVSVHGVTGLSVPPGDSDALAQALNTLLDNSGLRLSFGEHALRRVRSDFTIEKMCDDTLQLYSDLIAETSPIMARASER